MTDQREQAERALAALATAEPASWPPVADRVREARQRAGLTTAQVAERAGLPSASDYGDLELCDDEAFTCVSVGELHAIAAALGSTAADLLFGETLQVPPNAADFATISGRLAERIKEERTTPDAFGGGIGWDIVEVLKKPATLLTFNVVGFRDVCKAAGVDWIGAFLSAGGRPPNDEMQLTRHG